jgi:hypothetical protein
MKRVNGIMEIAAIVLERVLRVLATIRLGVTGIAAKAASAKNAPGITETVAIFHTAATRAHVLRLMTTPIILANQLVSERNAIGMEETATIFLNRAT